MKRKIVTSAAAGILALGTAAFSQVASVRIVTIDLTRVFNEYYKTRIASARLKDTVDSYRKEMDDMQERYKQQTAELDKLREEMEKTEYTQEVREQKKKAVEEKLADLKKTQDDITEYGRTHDQMLTQQRQRQRDTILSEIREAVNKHAKDAGYTLVLDKSVNPANGVPTVAYSLDSLDITDDIMKILNKNQPQTTEAPKPAQKKSETK
jgi:Skp family chaperone for outer membrane proteins